MPYAVSIIFVVFVWMNLEIGLLAAPLSLKWQVLNVLEGDEAHLRCVVDVAEKNSSSGDMEVDERRIIWEYGNDYDFSKTKSFAFFEPKVRFAVDDE